MVRLFLGGGLGFVVRWALAGGLVGLGLVWFFGGFLADFRLGG